MVLLAIKISDSLDGIPHFYAYLRGQQTEEDLMGLGQKLMKNIIKKIVVAIYP